jgi:predicted nucleic acid-binding protein
MATTDVKPVFVDTNILVYANLTQSPFHKPALSALENFHNSGAELWISRQVLREYLAVMTRPILLTASIPTESLIEDVRAFSAALKIAEETSQTTETLLSLLGKFPTAGKQIHDANIVASMLSVGVRSLLTNNAEDFDRFSSEIEILDLRKLPTA